jgi:hypothetical protein
MESPEATALRYIGVDLRKIAQTLDAMCKVLDYQNRLLQRMPPMTPTDMTPDDAETARDWESLQVNPTERTERLRISGGWLYRTIVEGAESGDAGATAVALVFVPGD